MKRLAWFVPAALAALALASLAMRLLFSHVDFYRDGLADKLSQMFALPVTVNEITSSIRGYTPTVVVSDITIGNPDRDEMLYFARLKMELDIWRSILARQAVFRSIVATDGRLDLFRDMSGAIRFGGAVAGLALGGSSVSEHPEISMYNIRLGWHDQVANVRYDLFAERLLFVSTGQRHYVKASLRLSAVMDERLDFVADFSGNLTQPASWAGRFHLQSSMLAIAEWQTFVPIPSGYAGSIGVSIWGNADQFQRGWVAGHIRCIQCASPYWQESNLDTSFYAERDRTHTRIALSDMTLQTPVFNSQRMNAVLRKEHASPWFDFALELQHFATQQAVDVYQLLQLPERGGRIYLRPQSGSLSLAGQARSPELSHLNKDNFVNALILSARSTQSLYSKLRVKDAQLFLAHQQQELDEISATVRLLRAGESVVVSLDDIMLMQGGARVRGNAGWYAENRTSSHLQISADIENLPLPHIPQWLPHDKVDSQFLAWFKSSFVHGDLVKGRIEVDGDPANFPFSDNNGRLFFSADLRNVNFRDHERKKLLENANAILTVDNTSLFAKVSSLQYSNIRLQQATVQIDDIMNPYLQVAASADAPLTDTIAYMLQEGLIESDLIRHMDFSGAVRLQLSFGTPLSKSINMPDIAAGTLSLDKVVVAVPGLGLKFVDMTGDLVFDHSGVRSDNLDAVIDGIAVKGTVKPLEGATVLSVAGQLPAQFFTDRLPQEWQGRLYGVSLWRAQLTVANLRHVMAEGKQFILRLQSDLAGTAVSFPTPFLKSSEEQRPVNLELHVGEHSQYHIHYGDFNGNFKRAGGKLLFARACFETCAQLPVDVAYAIGGRIGQTVLLDEWLRLGGGALDIPFPLHVNLDFKQLIWGNNDFKRSRMRLDFMDQQRWQAAISSAIIQGEISSVSSSDKIYLKAEMDSLALPDYTVLDDFSSGMAPDAVPLVELSARQFQYGDIVGRDLRFVTGKKPQTLLVDDLSFHVADVVVGVQGKWRRTSAGEVSDFTFGTQGQDYGRLLQLWNISEGLKDGHGMVSGRLKWQGSFKDFSTATLFGNIRLDLHDGVITDAQPGVARLLGLVNLSAVTRRLAMDFGDVMEKGLAFDTMTGALSARDGNLYTDDFTLIGPAMELMLTGRIGISARDYDQRMEVIPNLSSGLPVASALLGGPIAAAAVIVIDKITQLGRKADEAAALQYRIHGSWDAPEVELLGSKAINKFKQTTDTFRP